MQFLELLDHRRSTRSFTGESVTRSQLDAMLEAGTRAPNACNAQSWHFFATVDKNVISRIAPDIYRGEWIRGAGCVILIATDPCELEARFGSLARERFTVQDTAAAATQILQCATAEGLAGCWIGAFDRECAREFFSVPETMEPVIMLAIGHATAEPAARARKLMDEVVTYIGDCGEKSDELKAEQKPFELRSAYLPNAVFDDLFLGGATFNNICLQGAAFTDINMKNSTYCGLTMQGAKFGCVDLQDAVFENPDLSRTVFRGCNFTDVKLEACEIGNMTVNGHNIAELITKAEKKD